MQFRAYFDQVSSDLPDMTLAEFKRKWEDHIDHADLFNAPETWVLTHPEVLAFVAAGKRLGAVRELRYAVRQELDMEISIKELTVLVDRMIEGIK